MGLPPTSWGLLFRHQRQLAGQLVGQVLTPPVFVHRADTTLALAVFTVPDTNRPELSTPGRAEEVHQSGTCTCPETSHTSVAAADLGRRTSAGRATTRDPGTGSSRDPNHHGRCR